MQCMNMKKSVCLDKSRDCLSVAVDALILLVVYFGRRQNPVADQVSFPPLEMPIILEGQEQNTS